VLSALTHRSSSGSLQENVFLTRTQASRKCLLWEVFTNDPKICWKGLCGGTLTQGTYTHKTHLLSKNWQMLPLNMEK